MTHTALNPATVPSCPSLICDTAACYHFSNFCSFLCILFSFSFLYYIIISGIYPISPSHHDSTSFFIAHSPFNFYSYTASMLISIPGFLCLIACPHVSLPFSVLSPHFCAFIQTFLYSVLLFHVIPSLLLFFLSIVTHLFMYSIFLHVLWSHVLSIRSCLSYCSFHAL
jgi:hypothetical protein